MIPRLGDGNPSTENDTSVLVLSCLENDSPSRGRKPSYKDMIMRWAIDNSLENDSPSRGRKPDKVNEYSVCLCGLENDSPSRGRKPLHLVVKQPARNTVRLSLENDSPSRGRKLFNDIYFIHSRSFLV